MIDCSFYSPLIFFVNVNGYFGMIKGFGGVSSFGIVLELPSLQRFACIACPLLRFSLLSKDLQNLRRLCETDTQQLLVPFDPFKSCVAAPMKPSDLEAERSLQKALWLKLSTFSPQLIFQTSTNFGRWDSKIHFKLKAKNFRRVLNGIKLRPIVSVVLASTFRLR